ncbi:MAG: AI-2E family transporter, partial [Deltaproteobacteria bacterium]|nr:AI-2E family transporter [Deltaproteobacteria bacterium]
MARIAGSRQPMAAQSSGAIDKQVRNGKILKLINVLAVRDCGRSRTRPVNPKYPLTSKNSLPILPSIKNNTLSTVKREIQSNAVGVPPLPERRPSADEKTRVVRFAVSSATMIQLILVGACMLLLIRLWPVFLVLVVALLIVGTMSPAVTWMEARGVKRGLGIAIVFTLLFVVATLAVILTIPSLVEQASALVEQEPAFRARLSDYLARSNLTAPIAG